MKPAKHRWSKDSNPDGFGRIIKTCVSCGISRVTIRVGGVYADKYYDKNKVLMGDHSPSCLSEEPEVLWVVVKDGLKLESFASEDEATDYIAGAFPGLPGYIVVME